MRVAPVLLALTLLTNCGGVRSTDTFTCANGPDLVVTYSGDMARVAFPDGREEEVQRFDPKQPDFYANSGFTWDVSAFRTARFTDGLRSLQCDQLNG